MYCYKNILLGLIIIFSLTSCVFKYPKPDNWELEQNSKTKYKLNDTFAYYGENSEYYNPLFKDTDKKIKSLLLLTLKDNNLTMTSTEVNGTIIYKKITNIEQLDINTYKLSKLNGDYTADGSANFIGGAYSKETDIIYITKNHLYINSSSSFAGLMILPIPMPIVGYAESWNKYKRYKKDTSF